MTYLRDHFINKNIEIISISRLFQNKIEANKFINPIKNYIIRYMFVFQQIKLSLPLIVIVPEILKGKKLFY